MGSDLQGQPRATKPGVPPRRSLSRLSAGPGAAPDLEYRRSGDATPVIVDWHGDS
jgi:hypothetical protein